MTFHIHELHQKTKREILEVWEVALEHMDAQDKEIERLKNLLKDTLDYSWEGEITFAKDLRKRVIEELNK